MDFRAVNGDKSSTASPSPMRGPGTGGAPSGGRSPVRPTVSGSTIFGADSAGLLGDTPPPGGNRTISPPGTIHLRRPPGDDDLVTKARGCWPPMTESKSTESVGHQRFKPFAERPVAASHAFLFLLLHYIQVAVDDLGAVLVPEQVHEALFLTQIIG